MSMPAEVIELINALKSNKETSESSIGIGDITISDEFIDEYEPQIQKSCNPVAKDFAQPENQINDKEDINMDINKNHVPSTHFEYEDGHRFYGDRQQNL